MVFISLCPILLIRSIPIGIPLQPKLEALFKAKDELGGQLKTIREEGNSLAAMATQRKLELSEEGRRREKLVSERVQSPERLRRGLIDRESRLDRERHAVSLAEEELRSIVTMHEGLGKLGKDIESSLVAMADLESTVSRKKEVSSKVKDLKAQVELAESQLLEGKAHLGHVERLKTTAVEKLERLQSHYSQKRDFAQLQMEQQVREKEAIEAANHAKEAKLSENDAQIRQMEDKMKQVERDHEAHKKILLDHYAVLTDNLRRYIQANQKAMITMQS